MILPGVIVDCIKLILVYFRQTTPAWWRVSLSFILDFLIALLDARIYKKWLNYKCRETLYIGLTNK
jgi:hypothetical protein